VHIPYTTFAADNVNGGYKENERVRELWHLLNEPVRAHIYHKSAFSRRSLVGCRQKRAQGFLIRFFHSVTWSFSRSTAKVGDDKTLLYSALQRGVGFYPFFEEKE
jgi:hypothetical protein